MCHSTTHARTHAHTHTHTYTEDVPLVKFMYVFTALINTIILLSMLHTLAACRADWLPFDTSAFPLICWRLVRTELRRPWVCCRSVLFVSDVLSCLMTGAKMLTKILNSLPARSCGHPALPYSSCQPFRTQVFLYSPSFMLSCSYSTLASPPDYQLL